MLIDDHHFYPKGVHEVDKERGNYLIRMGLAAEYIEPEPESKTKSGKKK